MADAFTIEAEVRDRAGKGAARSARRAKKVPGVIYGDGRPPVMINMNGHQLFLLMQQAGFRTQLFDVRVDGATERTLVRDVQRDPVTDVPIHIDFLRVGSETTLTVEVPVQFVNEDRSPGLNAGGVLNVVRHTVELVCRADAIPDRLTVDLSGFDLGDSIHISAVTLPEGVRPAIGDRDFTVATISAPSALRSEGQDQTIGSPAEVPTVKGEKKAGES